MVTVRVSHEINISDTSRVTSYVKRLWDFEKLFDLISDNSLQNTKNQDIRKNLYSFLMCRH